MGQLPNQISKATYQRPRTKSATKAVTIYATHQISYSICETEIWLKVRPPEPPCPEGSQRSLGRRLLRDPAARAPASAAGVLSAPGAIYGQARPRTQFYIFAGGHYPRPRRNPINGTLFFCFLSGGHYPTPRCKLYCQVPVGSKVGLVIV